MSAQTYKNNARLHDTHGVGRVHCAANDEQADPLPPPPTRKLHADIGEHMALLQRRFM